MPDPSVGWLSLFQGPFILTLTGTHGPREAEEETKTAASLSRAGSLLPPTSSPASLDQPRGSDHEVEENVTAGLQADLHAVRQH